MNESASKTDTEDTEVTAQPAAEAAAPKASATESAPETPAAEPTVEAQLEAARAEIAAAKDAQLRALADLENFRRRTVRETEELRAFAAARIVEELMPVLDNLGLALTAAKAPNAELSALVQGVEMVGQQFRTALVSHGLKEVNPAGETFDPNLHEAVSQLASDDVEEGKVLQVVRVGYTLNGRLLRPATVVVSGGSADKAADEAKA